MWRDELGELSSALENTLNVGASIFDPTENEEKRRQLQVARLEKTALS